MIDLLACPLCGGGLSPAGNALACGCGRWPVVDGIPVLHRWARDTSPSLGDLLARFRPAAATLPAKLLRRLFPAAASLERAARRPGATFLELLADFGRTRDLDYFRYRFSDLVYLGSAALLTPLEKGPALDLGCGAGHLARALGKRIGAADVVGLDASFPLVWLAKRFLEPQASFVCADGAARLPFRDGAFEAAVCADVFSYLPDRSTAARELLRVARGPLLLSHLADPGFGSRSTHPPLSPEAYLELLKSRSPRIYRGRDLLDAFLARRVLDLSTPGGGPSDVLALTAGVAPRVYEGADHMLGGGSINPIYEVREEGDVLRLARRGPGPMPDRLTVTKAQVAARDPALVRDLILVDLPPRYAPAVDVQ
jgi:SAM-dependent methyltransferase